MLHPQLLRFLSLLITVSFIPACDYESQKDAALFSETKARLQAISYLDEHTIAVSDTAYYQGEWGEGRIILVDLKSKQRLGAWYSSISNPQALRTSSRSMAVLSSGNLVLGESPQGSWSSLSMLQIDVNGHFELKQELKLNHSPLGVYLVDSKPVNPTSDMLSFDESWILSSGIDAVLWKVGFSHPSNIHENEIAEELHDQAQQLNLKAKRYAPSDTLSLASVIQWKDYSLIIDFNQDRLYFVDQNGYIEQCSPELGRYEEVMEGAQTPVLLADRLWVGFGLSGRLIHFDLTQLLPQINNPNCEIDPVVYSPPLGQVPNDLKVIEDKVYVLHSAESALWTYSITSGERIAQRALPLQSNPWHMALSPNRQQLAISEWLSGGVSLLSLDQSGKINRLDSELFSPPLEAQCFHALEQIEFKDQNMGLLISEQGLELRWPKEAWEVLSDPALQRIASRDLQGAPQLALIMATDAPINLDVMIEPNGEWIELSPPKMHFTIQLNSSDLMQSFNDETEELREQERQLWQVDQNFKAESSQFKGYKQHGLLDDGLREVLASGFINDPCLLFRPKFQALTLDLSALLRQKAHDNTLAVNTERIAPGKAPLHAIRLRTASADSTQRLLAIAFRRWD